MVDWIIENKELVGIVVTIIGTVITVFSIIRRRAGARKTQKAGRDAINVEGLKAKRDINISVGGPTESEEDIPILRIIEHRDGSKFYRTVASLENNNIKNTVICLRIGVQNNGPNESAIAGYEISLPASGYIEELRPMTDGEKFRVLIGQSKSAYFEVNNSLVDDDGLIRVQAKSMSDIGNLFFTVPEKILSREIKQLECKLRIWDYDGHNAAYSFRLMKDERAY
jgi:hypothetical protein